MFIFLLVIILCFTEQQSWRLCPHSLWQVWPPWPWPWPPSAPPSIFFSKWRFSHLQAPAAATTLLLDPKRLRAFIPGWQGNNSRSTCTSSWAVVWGWWHRRRIKWWWGGGRGRRGWRWQGHGAVLFYDCIGFKAMFRDEGELLQHIATCDMI